MMSTEYMHSLKRDAERKSKREHITPFILLPCHKDGRVLPRIPFIGERTWKRDWRVADLNKLLPDITPEDRCDLRESNIFFVDSSGWGDGNELALTMSAFFDLAPFGFGYAIVEAGQFQVCVRAFIPPVTLRVPGVNYDVAEDA